MLTRREADALDRYLTTDPREDAGDAPACPICQEAEASDWTEGFMAPDGWEEGTVHPCRACLVPCVACGEGHTVKGRKGRCLACSERLGRKARRKANAPVPRPERRFTRRTWGLAPKKAPSRPVVLP